jgi:hypothetical protein
LLFVLIIYGNFFSCCQSPAFKFSRKASSSYSLRLESGRQKDHQRSLSGKRRNNSTPASPSHASSSNAGGGHHHHHHHQHGASSSSAGGGAAGAGGSTASGAAGTGREPQSTCMTPEQYARLRAQDPRFRGTSLIHPSIHPSIHPFNPTWRVGEGGEGKLPPPILAPLLEMEPPRSPLSAVLRLALPLGFSVSFS